MTYIDEVLDVFVTDVSTKLNIDFSWILNQSNENILTAIVKNKDKIQKYLNTKSLGHNISFSEIFFKDIDIFSNVSFCHDIINHFSDLNDFSVDFFDVVYIVKINKVADIVLSDSIESIKRKYSNYTEIQSLAKFAAERYLINNHKMVVSLEFFEKTQAFWRNKKIAQLFFNELALINISYVKNVDDIDEVLITCSNEVEQRLRNLASYFLIAESQIFAVDTLNKNIKNNGLNLNDLLSYVMARSIVEIKLAWQDKSVDLSDRVKRVIDDTALHFKEIFSKKIENFSILVADYIVSSISGFVKGIYQNIKKGGKFFKAICDEMWLFISNQNRTLLQTIVNISKAVASLALLTFTFGLHQYLLSAGIPESLVIVLVAFISSLATVAIFRLIEQAAQITGGIFYKRDIAKVRREEVERVCAELLPLIEEKVKYLDFLIEQEDIERTAIFNKSFAQIKESLASTQIDEIVSAYEELYLYLGKDLPFKNEKEFDDFMMDDSSFIL